MQRLDLNRTQLPASKFPDFADAYVCDKCGTDITEHLYRGRTPVWKPLGPARYICCCGEEYISGLVEWDDLGSVQKHVRSLQIIVLLLLLFLPLEGFMFLVRSTIERGGPLLVGLSGAALLPAVFLLLFFASFLLQGIEVAASLWRTRVRRRLKA